MGFLGLDLDFGWRDLVAGVASGVGFAFGGPLGAGLLGGAVSFALKWEETGDFEEGLQAGLLGAAFGAIPGGFVGGATKGLAGGGLKALGASLKGPGIKDAGTLMTKGGYDRIADRLLYSRGQMPRLGAGALTAGAGTALVSAIGPTGISYIPTRAIDNEPGVEMQQMLMPDMKHPDFPSRYQFLPAIESFHIELPKKLGKYYNAFANSLTAPMPPEGTLVPQITGADRANITRYAETVLFLEDSFKKLYNSSKGLAPLAHDSLEISTQGKEAIDSVVVVVNGTAGTVPQGGMNENDHILTYVTQALQEGDRIIKKATEDQKDVGSDVDKLIAELKALKDRLDQLEKSKNDPQQRSPDPADITPQSWTPPNAAAPPYVDPSTFPAGLGSEDNAGLNSQTPAGRNDLENRPSAIPSSTPPVPPPAATSPMGTGSSGMGMMDSLMPMILQQAMARSLADQDLNNHRAELDRRRYEDELGPLASPAITAQPATMQPPITQSAAAQPTSSSPATQQHGQPTGTTPSTHPAAASVRTPEADGSVIYTFPDGRAQKVSAMVAQALDGAFGNASGTDAQKAYERTPAKWSDKKQLGDRVDPYQLMTGDVATWDNRTA
ncbi:hypothetical protein ABZW96_37425, partial [Nocardia sp. NPDC004168]